MSQKKLDAEARDAEARVEIHRALKKLERYGTLHEVLVGNVNPRDRRKGKRPNRPLFLALGELVPDGVWNRGIEAIREYLRRQLANS